MAVLRYVYGLPLFLTVEGEESGSDDDDEDSEDENEDSDSNNEDDDSEREIHHQALVISNAKTLATTLSPSALPRTSSRLKNG